MKYLHYKYNRFSLNQFSLTNVGLTDRVIENESLRFVAVLSPQQ